MKAIQINFDEELLARLDADEQVQRKGRSAVLRQVTEDYLQQRWNDSIAAQYKAAYGTDRGLGEEFAGWTEQGVWSEE